MIRTLIVDDETLVRATLRTLVDWESLGYTIVQDCADGGQALNYLSGHPVDLLITDMKMPSVGGIELLRNLQGRLGAPVSIALSGYDEFELVREAFRLGAYDYLLKANLNADTLRTLLEQLKEKFFQKAAEHRQPEDVEEAFFQAEPGQYAVVLFSIDDFAAQASRFGSNLHEKLERPCWNWPVRSPVWPGAPLSGPSARSGMPCATGCRTPAALRPRCPRWCGRCRPSGGIT